MIRANIYSKIQLTIPNESGINIDKKIIYSMKFNSIIKIIDNNIIFESYTLMSLTHHPSAHVCWGYKDKPKPRLNVPVNLYNMYSSTDKNRNYISKESYMFIDINFICK